MTTSQDSTTSPAISGLWRQRHGRRWLALLVVLGSLLLLGFYTVTDSAHLHTSALLDGADWAGYALCHRITERSFTIAGRQFPLCARCTGMYLGAMLVFVVMALAGRLRRGDLPPPRLLIVLFGFIALMGIDGLNSYSHFFPNAPHLYEPRNWLRLLTGMGTGLAMGLIVLPALAQTVWRTPRFLPVLANGRELIDLLALAALLILLVLSNQSVLLYVMAIMSTLGLLLLVAALNTVVLLLLLRRDGRAATWKGTAVPLLGGLALAVLELSVIGYARFALTGTMTGIPGL